MKIIFLYEYSNQMSVVCANIVMHDQVEYFQAVKTKLIHSSYKQPHKPVSHSVFKVYNCLGKAHSRIVNQ